MKKVYLLLFVVFSIVSGAVAQTECSLYHRKNCVVKGGNHMTYDSQSKSAILGKGQISEFHMVAYKGLDYRISVCAEEVLGDQVQFRIYEKKRVVIKPVELTDNTNTEGLAANEVEGEVTEELYEDDVYSEDSYSDESYDETEVVVKKKEVNFKVVKELLYDNKDNGFDNKLEFTAEGPMSLIVEIIIPGSGNTSKLKIREMGCVGVLIQHKKSKKVGF